MTVKIKNDTEKLTITSFPKCLSGLCVAFLSVFWVAALTSVNNLEPVDYLIFSFVGFIGLAIQKHKTTTLNKKYNEAILVTKSILGTKIQKFILSDIKKAYMVYGKGSGYAKGGSVYLTIGEQEISIIDSDICPKNVDKNTQAQETISDFIK